MDSGQGTEGRVHPENELFDVPVRLDWYTSPSVKRYQTLRSTLIAAGELGVPIPRLDSYCFEGWESLLHAAIRLVRSDESWSALPEILCRRQDRRTIRTAKVCCTATQVRRLIRLSMESMAGPVTKNALRAEIGECIRRFYCGRSGTYPIRRMAAWSRSKSRARSKKCSC